MPKFRKKTAVIEAVQFTNNIEEICEFVGEAISEYEIGANSKFFIGILVVNKNDWVIKNARGEFYPCKPEYFSLTYEQVF